MEAKKVNLFAFLMIVVMCAVTIFVSVGKNNNTTTNYSNDILAINKKLDEIDDEFDDVDEKIAKSQGKSAYEIAKDNGFTGTEAEWLLSLKGNDGSNALTTVTPQEIYEAYKTAANKDNSYTYADFLTYYYSVMEKYDTETANSIALRSTVDICYSYSANTYYYFETNTGIIINNTLPEEKDYVVAGAGIIYQMYDSDKSDDYAYDTAYIITNYHVAYIENYSNDPNYSVYAKCKTVDGSVYIDKYYLGENNESGKSITLLNGEDSFEKHFLNGSNYYGIYLYDYKEEQYKLNATFVGGSAENDIAVLKVERTNQTSQAAANLLFESGNFVPATINENKNMVEGEDIIAVGNPLLASVSSGMTLEQKEDAYGQALVWACTSGSVSVASEYISSESILNSLKIYTSRYIRVDAAINAGNSGGGLYDLYGNLVGIVNSKIASSSYDNVGFAIPINIAVNIADQVIAQCDGTSPISQNTRIKVFNSENLGFSIENGKTNTSYDETKKEWNIQKNVVIKITNTSGLAFTSGLLNDDIITEVTFGGNTYSAEFFFNTDYELNDLLLKVALTETSITFKVARTSANSTLVTESVTINLDSSCFAEIV